MNVSDFIRKWRQSTLSERASAQSHFLDLCELLEHPKPAEVDPTGEWFAFEKGVEKRGKTTGQGWADVWKREHFGWEYKGKHKDLEAAHNQLLQYRESLGNPPLLVTCDIERIIIRTNWTNTPTQKHEIALDDLNQPVPLQKLRWVFHDPERLKPQITVEEITQKVASELGDIAWAMQQRNLEPTQIARFLDRIVFCLFAEDIELLPRDLFKRLVEQGRFNPPMFAARLEDLFSKMASGGYFGEHRIRHFNGSLFSDAPVLEMRPDEIDVVRRAALHDWKNVDPSIFGTLFERGLDPEKRSQLGAHYTSRDDIETLIEPIVMQPLRRDWDATREAIEVLLAQETSAARDKAQTLCSEFGARLGAVKVLDPACGSGNFLYVTLQKLKDFEKAFRLWCEDNGLKAPLETVRPEQLCGLEVNAYAFDLAQTTLWIGYLQWLADNGQPFPDEPILRANPNFKNIDAVLDLSDADNPQESIWPQADFIVGNPPFLGGSKLWEELGRDYQQKLWKVYKDRVPGAADLCCYWFEKARKKIFSGAAKRAGLIATQAIRGGANRKVLERIKNDGDIFFAESDRNWLIAGATVHVSMVGFDAGQEAHKVLDGQTVAAINANLTANTDVTQAKILTANLNIAIIGTKKAGSFNIPEIQALRWLHEPNPHGKPNSDVLRPWLNGSVIVQRPAPQWIIDCGTNMTEEDFSLYEKPFEHSIKFVKPERANSNEAPIRERWWLLARPRPEFRNAVQDKESYIATPRVSKHRIFSWLTTIFLPDDAVFTFARDDDYFFGILHSRVHEVWARAQGTQVRERESGFRYTPTSCFETFPFPEANEAQCEAIAEAAKVLCERRDNWLNPPEWMREDVLEFPGSADGPWARYLHDADARGVGTVRYPRLVMQNPNQVVGTLYVKDILPKRTLTNLYNERPTWLDLAHRRLDEAVCVAYGWPLDLSDEQLLERLLSLNLERAAAKVL